MGAYDIRMHKNRMLLVLLRVLGLMELRKLPTNTALPQELSKGMDLFINIQKISGFKTRL